LDKTKYYQNEKTEYMKYINYTLNLDTEGEVSRGEIATARRGKAKEK